MGIAREEALLLGFGATRMTSQQLAVGQRFSKLTILSIGRIKGQHLTAVCKCDCGNTKTIRTQHLLSGAQKGCGCGRAHTLAHGKSGTGIYQIWRSMRARCENPTDTAYRYYGARGIKVCEHWKKFEGFYADMGDKPPFMSLDRINVNGDYEAANCRWATILEQMNNTTRSHRVSYQGETMTVAEALRLANCSTPERTVYSRLDRGWDIETAMNHKGMLR